MAGDLLLDPNQAALGGQSPVKFVLHFGEQFTDNCDVITPMPQYVA